MTPGDMVFKSQSVTSGTPLTWVDTTVSPSHLGDIPHTPVSPSHLGDIPHTPVSPSHLGDAPHSGGHHCEPDSGGLDDGDAEGLGERCVDEDVSLRLRRRRPGRTQG